MLNNRKLMNIVSIYWCIIEKLTNSIYQIKIFGTLTNIIGFLVV